MILKNADAAFIQAERAEPVFQISMID